MKLIRLPLFFALIVFLILTGQGIAEEGQSSSLRLVPSEPLFPPPLAEPFPLVTSIKYFATNNSENVIAKIGTGATFGLARRDLGATALQLNIEGGIFSRADLYDRVVLETVDYRIGGSLDIADSPAVSGWALQFGFYHTSSHLIDDYLFKNVEPGEEPLPITYSRDVTRLLIAYRFSALNRIYGGIAYAFDGINWEHYQQYQLGSEFFTPPMILFDHETRLYLAEDLQTKQETDWNVNLNLQAGLSINQKGSERRLRLAIEYFAGNAVEGQFFTQREQNVGISASFDL
jgi:hypothetical protein